LETDKIWVNPIQTLAAYNIVLPFAVFLFYDDIALREVIIKKYQNKELKTRRDGW
jgi:hypothetical protein